MDKIRAGALVCTSNQRLARHISAGYDHLMLAEGRRAWSTPRVMELSAWLASLVSEQAELGADQTLLSNAMALSLWEELLSKDFKLSGGSLTLAPYRNSLIALSYEAYCLLTEHRVELPSKDIYLSEEVMALKRWSASYELLLKEKGFLSPSKLSSVLSELISKGEVNLDGSLLFAGFEEVSPALSLLAGALKASGVDIDFWPKELPDAGPSGTQGMESKVRGVELFSFSDIREEIVSAARWAREEAARGMKTGIIVANLTQYRELIEREFALELSPASALLDNARSISDTFNISMAASLSKSHIVKAALDFLSLTRPAKREETEVMWEIFSSPYLSASMEEYLSLGALDARFRQNNRSELSLNSLSNELSKDRWETLSGFKKRIDFYIESIKPKDKKLLKGAPSFWAGRFTAELRAFGWPGNTAELTSREFQAFEAFNVLLSEFAALDDITPSLTRGEAAGRLMRMAERKSHQPKSPETLIEVIGLSESIGFEFDSVRVIGAYSGQLPGMIAPNPFIPIGIQRELKLARACPELESKRAKERLLRLIDTSSKVVVSFPERVDDKEVRVSPFFSSLKKADSEVVRESKRFRDSVLASSLLEDMESEVVVGFSPTEMEGLRGGTSILKEQSACPFKAFATYRLGAKKVESPEPGLSHMDRGSLVHSALQNFWKEVKGSDGLDKLIREERLVSMVKGSVTEALKPYEKRAFKEVNYLNLEKERLKRLLLDWLHYEATRGPFTVESLEAEDERAVSGLNIKFRIDRVDSVAGLGDVVIDYKTGACSRQDWFGARPKDPQMLIYNLFGPYEALAFAQVKFGASKFDAVAKSEGMVPKNKGFEKDSYINKPLAEEGITSFDSLTDSWRKVVEGLARDFVDGAVAVDPNEFKGAMACDYSYCDLKALCRIFDAEDLSGDEL